MPTTHRVDGRLHLCFGRPAPDAEAQLQIKQQTPPLRVIRAFPTADHTLLTHIHNVSGGVLGGDQLHLCVDVQADTQVQLTSTGATRVYRHRPAYADATQQTTIQVATGGVLEYLPDLLIPYAGARYRQVTQIDLADNAGLFYWEIVAPGREAHNELFAYEELEVQLDIRAAGRPIVLERLHLTPATKPLHSLARLGPYRYVATFYLCRVGVPAATWLRLEKTLQEIAQSLTDPQPTDPPITVWGVSTVVAHGLGVRGLSMNSRALLGGLPQFWQAAKWALYGQNAVMPRKVY